jgi:hypothetical protein
VTLRPPTLDDILPWLIAALLLLLLASTASCSLSGGGSGGGGWIRYANQETGERWEVQNPPKAEAPAQLSRGEGGQMTAAAGPPRREDTAVKQLWLVPLIGVGLIVLGIGTLTLRGWFASVPMGASLASMATGATLIAAPKIVQEAWWLILLVIGATGLVIVMYATSWWDNHRKLKGAT